MAIALLPLDNRPLNYAAIRRASSVVPCDALLPPAELVGGRETAPELFPVAKWLLANSNDRDVVLSLDALLYGGLIQARVAKAGSSRALDALRLLSPLASRARSVRAFLVWKRVWGNIFTSRSLDRVPALQQLSIRLAERLGGLNAFQLYCQLAACPESLCGLPADDVSLFAQSRLNMLEEAARIAHNCAKCGISLHIAVEDSIAGGVQDSELEWLRQETGGQFTIADGADEAGAVLLAGLLAERSPAKPIGVYVPRPYSETAPYESKSVSDNLAVLCGLAGAVFSREDAGQHLRLAGVPETSDHYTMLLAGKVSCREPGDMLKSIKPIQAFSPSVLCELTATNGINLRLMEQFAQDETPPLAVVQMNTISNRIGHALLLATALREAEITGELAGLVITSYLEDLIYQAHLRTWAVCNYGGLEPESEAIKDEAECTLSKFALDIAQRKFGGARLRGKRIQVDSVKANLPWRRWFECEFAVDANLK